MKTDLDYVRKIKDLYQQKYVHQELYSQYITSWGISSLSALVELHDGLVLQEWESLDDYCIKVNLSQPPPKELKLPSFYCGVRVHYEVIREIKPRDE